MNSQAMDMAGFIRLSLLLVLFKITLGQTVCFPRNSDALLAFKAGLDMPGKEFSTWSNATSCCLWSGVTCDSAGQVIELALAPVVKIRQRGTVDLIGTSLSDLTELETLSLTNFNFGVQPPSGLRSLAKLSTLHLADNLFGGEIPSEFFQRPSLLHVNLSGNPGLHGNLPESLCLLKNLQTLSITHSTTQPSGIEGPIPECLSDLSALVTVELANNWFSGSIPAAIGSLVNLQSLRLSNNLLTVDIPSSFGNLSNLQVLDLQGNVLKGSMPPSFGALAKLEELTLGAGEDFQGRTIGVSRGFGGSIPEGIGGSVLKILRIRGTSISGSIPESLGFNAHLNELVLSDNDLSGPIPATVAALKSLEILDLALNKLTGSVPDLSGSRQLKIVILGGNQLTGTIPATLASLPTTTLDLSNNQLTGVIPTDIGDPAILGEKIDLSNNQLTGAFPASLWNFRSVSLSKNQLTELPAGHLPVLNTNSQVEQLWLDSNSLSGEVPPWVLELKVVRSIDLSNNKLVSPLPPIGTSITSINYLNMSHNSLSGSIPEEFGSLSNLNTLDLSFNQLTGPIPAMISSGSRFLNNLILSHNQLSGPLPDALFASSFYSVIDLSHNNLSGPVPAIPDGTSPFLSYLDLSYNELSGEIPMGLFTFSFIKKVKLDHNKFSGPIPDIGAACTDGLKDLSIVTLNDNLLYGELEGAPWILACAGTITLLDISGNAFSGAIPDFSTWSALRILSLARNNFTGGIPTWLFTDLASLQVLDLANNKLDGSLPALSIEASGSDLTPAAEGPYYKDEVLYNRGSFSFSLSTTAAIDVSGNALTGTVTSTLTELTVLNLSKNNFTGQLPESLGTISELKLFTVAYNQFNGAIPEDLQQFPPSSFEGNPALCGPPTPKPCP